jgi:hypothetical protein
MHTPYYCACRGRGRGIGFAVSYHLRSTPLLPFAFRLHQGSGSFAPPSQQDGWGLNDVPWQAGVKFLFALKFYGAP